MSKLTLTIPDDLHQKIREEQERQGITTSQFIEQAVSTFFEKTKGVSNMAARTLSEHRSGMTGNMTVVEVFQLMRFCALIILRKWKYY